MTQAQIPDSDSRDFIAEADTGARAPTGAFNRRVLWYVPLIWSLFQLWIASPIPYELGFFVVNNAQARSIHLAFAVFLAFTAFPTSKRSPRHKVPVQDWAMALIAAFSAAYLYLFWDGLAARSGAPSTQDLVFACIGIVLLLEAARRSLGFPLMAVAVVSMGYVFFGSSSLLPDVIRWRGASIERAMSHFWLTSEGVFGVALGVSSGFVFLFVLFGALLNRAGAGNYFLSLAFATLGHLRGGPAKAAVIASAATGLISGSSIANVVTTGTFTIPLMKKVGFSPAKAGAIEVSSSINGVLTPPVMGAVAFLMTEYVGISYVEVVRTAIVPAAISYIALLYIVHLEALKMGMKGTSRMNPVLFLLRAVFGVSAGIVAAGAILWSSGQIVGLLEVALGAAASPLLLVLFLLTYVLLVRIAAKRPDLDLSIDGMQHLPPTREILRSGLHYLMPIFLLMYLLMVERRSPGYSAFWSACFMLLVLLTQHPLKAFMRGQGNLLTGLRAGISEAAEGLIEGARNMIGLACAMAVAGIIVGSVTLTGIGQVMAEFVEYLSGGNLMLMLIFVAMISIVLGMGLPTTANYIVVSSLMAGVVVQLGAQNGLIVPLVAVHMFVFYFGIMADVTPPVGLASFAAAAISGGDPMKTGFQAFFYSIRTALLPFLFIFNTDLLLIDVTWAHAIVVFIVALVAMLVFAAGTMGWFVTRSRLWESVALVLVALTLFRPGFWLDQVQDPWLQIAPTEAFATAEAAPDGAVLRMALEGTSLTGRFVSSFYELPLGADGRSGFDRLAQSAGMELVARDGTMVVDMITFGGPAEQAGIDFDWTVTRIELPNERMPKEIFYLPAMLLMALVAWVQRRRHQRDAEVTA